jgi:glyoxylase-like metal-dependent hydrolase (beta-lactamase superfamily II)
MNMEMPGMQIRLTGIVVLLLAMPIQAAEQNNGGEKLHYDRQEVAHRFGTTQNAQFLPKTAINSEAVPDYTLQEFDSADAVLPYYQLADNTYFFFGNIAEVDENNRGWNGNAGFVVTPEGVVVIDSLGTPKLGQRMIATIRSITDQPIKYLIITHNHPDHAYGAVAFSYLPGVTIIGHQDILKYLNSDRIEHSVAYRETFIASDMAGFKAIRPDILVDVPLYDKITIKLGKDAFDIYNVGAQHSYGDLIVHQRNENIVWVADLVFNNRVTFMADGNSKLAIAGQDWLLKNFAGVSLVVPGHGSAQTKPFPMVEKTRSYMARLRRVMAREIEAGVDLQDAVSKADFADWKAVRLYDLNQRANANFVYREMEEVVF